MPTTPDRPADQPVPFRYVDEDGFCLSARLLPDLNTGGTTDTLSLTIEGSDEPQSAHVPVAELPKVLAGIAESAGLAVARQLLGTSTGEDTAAEGREPTDRDVVEAHELALGFTMTAEGTPAAVPPPADRTDLPARLQAVLTERFTELGNPFSRMRRQEKGPDGWPAEFPVGPHGVAEVLRELLADEQPPAPAVPLPEVWTVWRENDPTVYGHFATVNAARQGTIDCWQEDEPSCPDYSWRQDGPRLELVVGGEPGGVYASRYRVYGAPPAPADRAAILRERADFYDQWLRDSASSDSDPRYCQAVHDIALGLRRLAGEAAAGAHHPKQADTVLAAAIPEWEAVYEPGNVSDYLIGYANSEAAAKGAAIAWVLSQSDKIADRLEWTATPHGDDHDEHFELSERHDDGIDTAVGVTVQRRLRPYTAADFAPEDDATPAVPAAPEETQ